MLMFKLMVNHSFYKSFDTIFIRNGKKNVKILIIFSSFSIKTFLNELLTTALRTLVSFSLYISRKRTSKCHPHMQSRDTVMA